MINKQMKRAVFLINKIKKRQLSQQIEFNNAQNIITPTVQHDRVTNEIKLHCLNDVSGVAEYTK